MFPPRLLALSALAFTVFTGTAEASGRTAADLETQAAELGLARSPVWLNLVHYEDPGDGTLRSLAGGAHFFLSPDGPTDPAAELAATIEAIATPGKTVKDGEHPQCAFRARTQWLRRELRIVDDELPDVPCDRFHAWMDGLSPTRASMVFPEAYMNNPASMFGHTLLKIDGASDAAGSDLLAYAINFAAESGGEGGVAFAFKGIFGGYAGHFSVLPYYEKLKQYGDWENRDVWEYALDLSQDELELLLAHVWELRGIPFQYFFFDDNCSYQLFALLEVIRPELELTSAFPLWAIPLDTVRETAERTTLFESRRYRPAPVTRIRYQSSLLSPAGRDAAYDLALGDRTPSAETLAAIPEDERARALSLAHTYLRYRFVEGMEDRDPSAARSRRLLGATAALGLEVPEDEPPTPKYGPEEGHRVARFDFGGGVRDAEPYAELRLRPAFHGLLDATGGYTPGAQIQILETAVRFEPERSKLRLESVSLVDVISLSPRGPFIKPISWRAGLGLENRMLARDADSSDLQPRPVGYARASVGPSWRTSPHLLVYGFATAHAQTSPYLDDHYTVGPGLEIGALMKNAAEKHRSLVTLEAMKGLAGDRDTEARAVFEHTYYFDRNTGIGVEASVNALDDEVWTEGRIVLRKHFRYPWGKKRR